MAELNAVISQLCSSPIAATPMVSLLCAPTDPIERARMARMAIISDVNFRISNPPDFDLLCLYSPVVASSSLD